MSQARSHPDTLRMPKHTRGAPGALTYTAQTRWLVTEVIVRVVQQEVVLEVVEQEMAYLEGAGGGGGGGGTSEVKPSELSTGVDENKALRALH